MLNFFMEGGWGMWPVLGLGLLLVLVSGRYAVDLRPARLRLVVGLALTLLVTCVGAMLSGFAMVLSVLGDPTKVSDADFTRIMMVGFKECTRPGALGGAFLALGGVLACVGLHRTAQREP